MNRRVATCILAAAFAVAVAAGGPAAKTDRDIGELFTAVLAEHVDAGRVDYAALCGDERLDEVVERMSSVDPGAIENAADRFAFWINAYNAFTLKIVCDNYPIESINDLHFGGLAVGRCSTKRCGTKS